MPIPDELYNVKFADYFELIKAMYVSDDRFKIMCNDYCSSKKSVEFYRKKIEKCFRHKLEFENLSKELEEEILFYIMRNS